jgi:membrane protease subunit (stomatin/prohibitin family)
MQVIQFQDPTGQTMVARWPREGTAAIQLGSQLIVEESQKAVFFRDGKALDTFGPGRHTLATQNLPLLTSLLGLPFGGKSPFQAAVFFVSQQTFLDLKWGTKEPVVFRDRELAMVRLRAFGKFAVRVVEPQLFVNTVVGTAGAYTTDGVEAYFRDAIVARLNDLLGENLDTVFDLPKVYDELAMALKTRVGDDFGKYGIELVDLFLGAITPPPEVQAMIDERSGMGAVGNLDAYLKFKAARAMGDAAQGGGGEAGGAAAAGMGLGVGAGLGMMLPGMMREAMQGGGGSAGGATPAGGSGGGAAAGGGAGGSAGGAGAAPGGGAGAPEGGPGAAGEGGAQPAGGGAAAAAFCHQCGSKLPAGARFCPSCGTQQGG